MNAGLVLPSGMLIVMVAGLLSGCAAGSDYVRPELPMPERFQRQTTVEHRDLPVSAESAHWWTEFGDPQLSQFVELAQKQNLDLAQASARVSQARAMLAGASAALRPFGGISGQAARAYQSTETSLGLILDSMPGSGRYGNAYEGNVGASWELDIFGGLRREREAATFEYQGSEAGAAAMRLAVAAQAADTYITIRGLQTRLEIARRQAQTQQDLLSTIKLLHGSGLAADRELWQAEGALAQVRASVPVLEAGIEVASNALAVLVGSPPGTYRATLAVAGEIPTAPKISAIGSPRDLLRRRPDLIVAERRLAASNARVGVAIAEYYPKLSLSGLIGSASTSGDQLFTSGASQAAGVFGLRWRLFDFGRINAQIEAAKGHNAEMLAAYRIAALRATEDVENAISTLIKREEQAEVLEKGADSLQRARDASYAAYQKGVVGLIEVLQADENLLRIADARAQVQMESARAAVTAFKALGGDSGASEVDSAAKQKDRDFTTEPG